MSQKSYTRTDLIEEKKRKSLKPNKVKKLLTNVVEHITCADEFSDLEFLQRYSNLQISCPDFDTRYERVLNEFLTEGRNEFAISFDVVDRNDGMTLATAMFTENGIKIFPTVTNRPISPRTSIPIMSRNENFALLVKPKFISVAADGQPKVGEMYSSLSVPVLAVKKLSKDLYEIYKSNQLTSGLAKLVVRGKAKPAKWVAKTIGASYSATDFKVYPNASTGTPSIASIYPKVDWNIFDTANNPAKLVNIDFKTSTANLTDRVAVLGAAFLLCIHKCLKEIHPVLESYQKHNIKI